MGLTFNTVAYQQVIDRNTMALISRTISGSVFGDVGTIRPEAFNRCSLLTEANFPACKIIGDAAFYACLRLTSVSFPACTTIGVNAFNNCTSLTEASFPACRTIGRGAFAGCTRLVSLTLGASSVVSLNNSDAFRSTPIAGYSTTAGMYGSIYVPASLVESYKTAAKWSLFSSRITAI